MATPTNEAIFFKEQCKEIIANNFSERIIAITTSENIVGAYGADYHSGVDFMVNIINGKFTILIKTMWNTTNPTSGDVADFVLTCNDIENDVKNDDNENKIPIRKSHSKYIKLFVSRLSVNEPEKVRLAKHNCVNICCDADIQHIVMNSCLTNVVNHISTVIKENEKNLRDVNYNNDNIDSNMKILTGHIKELCGKISINDEIANKLINLINIDEDYHQFVEEFVDLYKNLTSRTRTYDPKYDIPIITTYVNDINKKINSIINTINKIYKINNLPEIKECEIDIKDIIK